MCRWQGSSGHGLRIDRREVWLASGPSLWLEGVVSVPVGMLCPPGLLPELRNKLKRRT